MSAMSSTSNMPNDDKNNSRVETTSMETSNKSNKDDKVSAVADLAGGSNTSRNKMQNNKKDSRNRRRGNGGISKNNTDSRSLTFHDNNNGTSTSAAAAEESNAGTNDNNSVTNKKAKKRKPRKKNPKKPPSNDNVELQNEGEKTSALLIPAQAVTSKNLSNNKDASNNKKKKKKSSSQNKKRLPWWTKRLPYPDVADPISLEPLLELKYPPFALKMNDPYDVIPVWPLDTRPTKSKKKKKGSNANSSEQQEEEQPPQNSISSPPPSKSKESIETHVNLYDGRCLAYYLVSQLSFIDPLNRRELRREELINLDVYLERHRLGKANVVEAYDQHASENRKFSTNIVEDNTGRSRAQVLAAEARSLLEILFANSGVNGNNRNSGDNHSSAARNRASNTNNSASAASSAFRNAFEQDMRDQNQDAASNNNRSRSRDNTTHTHRNHIPNNYDFETDIGYAIIDDDVNPGMRGGRHAYAQAQVRGQQRTRQRLEDQFPALSGSAASYTPAAVAAAPPDHFPSLEANSAAELSSSRHKNQQQKGPSKSLQKITNGIAPTDPRQVEKQRKAREDAQLRAAMSHLSFQGPTSIALSHQHQQMLPVTSMVSTPASEGQIERNRLLANALGVAPSTLRSLPGNTMTGWKRPTTQPSILDEFGNELNRTDYSDTLLRQIHVSDIKLDEVIKLEKKWRFFCMDDTAASLPLRPMKRYLRAFVHEYSDYWKLHTESFDLEPKRYINCVKLADTAAPTPLLSEAVKNYRGPSLGTNTITGIARIPPSSIVSQQNQQQQPNHQAAGETSVSHDSVKLMNSQSRSESTNSLYNMQRGLPLSVTAKPLAVEGEISARFTDMTRVRSKLNLAPRTLPREEHHAAADVDSKVDTRQVALLAEKEQKRRAKQALVEERKQHILNQAFASDDEDASSSDDKEQSCNHFEKSKNLNDSESDWEEEDAIYHGSDDEK
eukprot:CAMPEP_0194424466 /NCGR_PEP_ID=MMETSP0176-20130528/23736_1 /TAXON_ID=216777 /ORGANISM="Proboscia alata, Strain PI-D3" /LENGTH=952 /DNA_ID=CAMNT_0039234247 /DNA_START=41 /DNA_END=2899 /DNA_ORIENTATION=-